jgi:hypothetical protein
VMGGNLRLALEIAWPGNEGIRGPAVTLMVADVRPVLARLFQLEIPGIARLYEAVTCAR